MEAQVKASILAICSLETTGDQPRVAKTANFADVATEFGFCCPANIIIFSIHCHRIHLPNNP